ncbi:hypothetical protein LC653_36395 [Nostoc sp. CHAB 5784]|uniref:terpene synthase family protein n=1 Tax=Nostoc mirabile TaxID=2907820 RepID=UPI001E3CC4EB|nr:hypothetical protein [Nostoc mirabile]MCC5669182.1 hypothetical protein [Nostoc mirabile CHAB5784]
MSALFIPWLYIPFPEQINEYAQAVEEHTLKWALKFKLVRGEKHYQHFQASKYGQIVVRACPKATLENLAIASDLITFFYLLDDQCDEANIGKQPEQLRVVFSRFLDVMKQPSLFATDTNPSLASLSDIWQRIHQKASSNLVNRFVNNFKDFFEVYTWEAENRAKNITPSLDTYIKMRSITGGFHWCLNITELVEGINLPTQVRECDEVQNLIRSANNVCTWLNDIVSVEKELKCGDIHNLVLLLQHEYQLTAQEALNRTAELWNVQLQTFIALEQQLPSFGVTVDIELGRYLASIRSWMRAVEHWSYQSGRYRSVVPAQFLQPVAA